jgi:hypothetical protein
MKRQFDPYNPEEVYDAIRAVDPERSAKYYTPSLVAPYIPEGADPKYWVKILRNVEYLRAHPKSKPRRRRSPSTSRKNTNYAELVTRRTTFDALMAE